MNKTLDGMLKLLRRLFYVSVYLSAKK